MERPRTTGRRLGPTAATRTENSTAKLAALTGVAVIVLGLATAQAEADDGWGLDRKADICVLTRADQEREILILHAQSPNQEIGDLFSFAFRSPALRLAPAKLGEEVRLIFKENDDPSHREMRITGKQASFDGLSVQTLAPATWVLDALRTVDDFTKVDVEAGFTFDTFDVTGLSTSLPALLACAKSATN